MLADPCPSEDAVARRLKRMVGATRPPRGAPRPDVQDLLQKVSVL